MYFEEFGKENQQTIVMLHGAFFVHTYGRQYVLAKQYHILVPHIMGFGNHTEKDFNTEDAIEELYQYIAALGRKVTLVGFSLGAQLAYELVCRHQELFRAAIIVSPWLIKSDADLPQMLEMNLAQLRDMHNRTKCRLIAMMNGLPGKAGKEFVEQMQHVTEGTVRNCADNGIVLSENFRDVRIPVTAIAGGKEQQGVIDSVKGMAEMNAHCECQIWPGCAHNIPPMHAKDFNALIVKEMLSDHI